VATTDEEDYSYAALVNRWRRERATTALTRMDDRFYLKLDRHLRRLHDDFHKEQAVNPATPKVLILLDEVTNLQRVRDDIYDLRERKILTLAIIEARDGKPDHSNLTKEERAVYDSVLAALKAARADLLRKQQAVAQEPGPAPKAPAGPPSPPDAAPPTPTAAQAAAPDGASAHAAPEPSLPGQVPDAPKAPAHAVERVDAAGEDEARPATPRVLVRIVEDVEPFVAPDLRHYHLKAEDVAALPRDVAHLLVGRGLAAAISG